MCCDWSHIVQSIATNYCKRSYQTPSLSCRTGCGYVRVLPGLVIGRALIRKGQLPRLDIGRTLSPKGHHPGRPPIPHYWKDPEKERVASRVSSNYWRNPDKKRTAVRMTNLKAARVKLKWYRRYYMGKGDMCF